MHQADRGRIAALDLGEVRTGVAVSDPGRVLASPLDVVPSAELTDYLRGLVEERGVHEVVVGMPRTLGGEVGFQARKVLATLDRLKQEFPGIRFVEWDERLTSRLAAGGRRTGRAGGKRGTVRVDHLAAARMLQEYLEAGRNV
ncbi:MAG: Holliday junction resolvase RuvX [Rubrobacter sp.]|nr:Holliday junction resolvase RuvX [Rubrobacter sp.]